MIIDGVVPGLNYAADSAGEMSVAERRPPWFATGRGTAALDRPSLSDGPPKKRRDGASPSQSSRWNYFANEGLSFMTDSQASKAMNSSGGREARGRTRGVVLARRRGRCIVCNQ